MPDTWAGRSPTRRPTGLRSGGLILLLGLGLPALSWAAETCFRLSPFDDTLRLTYKTGKGLPLVVQATQDGAGIYQAYGGGHAYATPTPGVLVVDLVLYQNSGFFFDGNPNGSMQLRVEAVTGDGSFYASYGGPVEPPFPIHGQLALIDCEAPALRQGEAGPLAGQPRG